MSDSDYEEPSVVDIDISRLSTYGKHVVDTLRTKHPEQYGRNWNVTCGKVVGEIQQTPPRKTWGSQTIAPGASDEFPRKMAEVISRTEEWCDVSSLAPPDGQFTEHFAQAMLALHKKNKPIKVRMLFGNLTGMPCDCDAICGELHKLLPDSTEDPPASQLEIYVGAYRAGPTSWNHSKIIAVDGKYLFAGGHNLWDPHYLQVDPVHDLSAEYEGHVAVDGHRFVDTMWEYIERMGEKDCLTNMYKAFPDWVPGIVGARVCMGHYPWIESMEEYPLRWKDYDGGRDLEARSLATPTQGTIPMITCGRYGAINHPIKTSNGSDDAISILLAQASKVVRMSLQDLGPLTIPISDSPISIPGGVWPEDYLESLAMSLSDGAQVQIVLSAPHAVPGGLSPLAANYGNGWTCEDVASEILIAYQKYRLQEDGEEVREGDLREMLEKQIKVCHIRAKKGCDEWVDGQQIGNHAKFFIVDDSIYYCGSQNLYIANLAEWGVMIDDVRQTKKIVEEYWNPLWENSYTPDDCNFDAVIEGLDVDRKGKSKSHASKKEKIAAAQASRAGCNISENSKYHEKDHAEAAHQHGLDAADAKKHYSLGSVRR